MPGTAGQVERREGGQGRIMTNRNVTIISGGEVVMADTTNLGPGGMFVATDESFGIGDRFICRIDLGEPYKPVLSGAEVRWINALEGHRGMGVKFLDIAEAAESLGGDLPAQGPETVKVRLESVGSAIDADVIERNGQEIVVDLELPFLTHGTPVEIGPDVAARTAGITGVESVTTGESGGFKVRLTMDIEPSPAQVAAGRVVTDATRKMRPSSSQRVWQRPARLPGSSRPEQGSSPIPQEVVEATDAIEGELEKGPDKLQAKVEDIETRIADIETQTEELETRTVDHETRTEEQETRAEDSENSAEASFFDSNDDESSDDIVLSNAESEDIVSDDDESEELEAEAVEKKTSDDELDAASFNPIRGALERVIGAAMVTRLAALWTRCADSVKARINGPKLLAAALWCRERAGRGWTWTRKRLGPAMGKAWKALRSSSVLRRRRRQARGEPSRVVQNLTERARKVAAGRGKTVAIVIFAFMGLAGLGTAGYGLWGSATAEQEREQLSGEAASAGWSSTQWDEPEPVDGNDPS